jgi:hypothetical protein
MISRSCQVSGTVPSMRDDLTHERYAEDWNEAPK